MGGWGGPNQLAEVFQVLPSSEGQKARSQRVKVPQRRSRIPDKGEGLRAALALPQVNLGPAELTASEGVKAQVQPPRPNAGNHQTQTKNKESRT